MPKTKTGRWAVWLIGVFIAVFGLTQAIYIASVGGVNLANNNPLLPMLAILGFGAGIASFVLSLMSIFKFKEHSAILYIILAVGLIPVIFVLGEFLVPH